MTFGTNASTLWRTRKKYERREATSAIGGETRAPAALLTRKRRRRRWPSASRWRRGTRGDYRRHHRRDDPRPDGADRLDDAETVMRLVPSWPEDYNEVHPHKGLKMLSPREHRRLGNQVGRSEEN